MKSVFITGTDTGVGKTVISASLAAYLSIRKNQDVGVMKPFESGSSPTGGDAQILREASGTSDDMSDINPYLFPTPAAPEVAARLDNVVIDMDRVTGAYRRLVERHDIVIVEGAGGLLVPISDGFFYADLISSLAVPTIIVSKLSLGTINHTMLTDRYLRAIGVTVIGVILNDTEGNNDVASRTNPDILKKYLDVPLLGIFPHIPDVFAKGVDKEHLAELFERHINCELFFERMASTERVCG